MLQITSLPGKGRGYVATTDIPAGTQVHVSEPLATTVSQEWMPETCLYCFDFSYPKKQKVRAMTPEQERVLRVKWKLLPGDKRSLFKHIFFCSEHCKSQWDPFEFEQLMVSTAKIDIEFMETGESTSDEPHHEGDLVLSGIETKDDASLGRWLDDAWTVLTEDLDLYKEISDTERTMCRLIAACLIRKHNGERQQQQNVGYEELFQIQNNELNYFRSIYSKPQLPSIPKGANTKETYLRSIPEDLLDIIKLYCFFSRATSDILPVDHIAFRDIYFRERSNSFGLWEKSNDSEDVTDDLELLGWGIYPSAVYFNHSCDANVVKKRLGRNMVFVTRHMIEKGQEACISYGNVDADLRTRRARLFENYNFCCQCTRCKHEEIMASLRR